VQVNDGEIKALDMPPMTMVFVAKKPALLKSLSPGDEVVFEAFEANGQYSVGNIQKK
jgi:Cu/Ag efflux protein CusF